MTVGWYVHHHGSGHRQRLAATLPHLDGVVALSSSELAGDAVLLPGDETDAPRDATAAGTLHWVPLAHPGLRGRTAAISAWIEDARPDVMVVDVSVEVALLARLHGVPTVLIAQRGRRTDPPHALAFAQAAAIAAPWTAETHLPGDGLPDERVQFVGAISRLPVDDAPATSDDLLLLLGAGGHGVTAEEVRAAAAATPGRTWHVAGPLRAEGPGIVDHGPAADVGALLDRCAVVAGSAGGNVVAEVAARRRAFVCLPQPRPFAEQERQGEALRRLGAAEVVGAWPEAAAWPGVLAAAEARDRDGWRRLDDGGGARRLAAVIRGVA